MREIYPKSHNQQQLEWNRDTTSAKSNSTVEEDLINNNSSDSYSSRTGTNSSLFVKSTTTKDTASSKISGKPDIFRWSPSSNTSDMNKSKTASSFTKSKNNELTCSNSESSDGPLAFSASDMTLTRAQVDLSNDSTSSSSIGGETLFETVGDFSVDISNSKGRLIKTTSTSSTSHHESKRVSQLVSKLRMEMIGREEQRSDDENAQEEKLAKKNKARECKSLKESSSSPRKN